MEWLTTNQLKIEPPKRPKKITGTRFAAIFGKNKWSSPFKVWCEITRTYEEPFVDNQYTKAGRIIEPKLAEYMRRAYYMPNLKSPTDIFGKDYFERTFGDFFHEYDILGGMWDFLLYEEGKPIKVLEMKTTKRAEDWKNGIPEYYALQAALYAYLLGIDDVIMVAAFLTDEDYTEPEKFVPTSDNTIVRPFKVHERFPNFEEMIIEAKNWWNKHVMTGISPVFNETADADILKALRTNTLNPDTDVEAVLDEAERLQAEIDAVTVSISEKEKRLKTLRDIIKELALSKFRDGDKTVTIPGKTLVWSISKSETTNIDKKALKADGLLDKYSTTTCTYRLTSKPVEREV